MRFCSLSSSSYANCVIIQDNSTCVLVDCGLRKRDIKPYLNEVGVSPGDIDAILLTHCHSDHIYGLNYLLEEKNVRVYSTAGVIQQLVRSYCLKKSPRFDILRMSHEERIGTISLVPFGLSHDVETIGFIFSDGSEKLGFLTDTGFVSENCIKAFKSLDYIYIESNHDTEMYKYSSKPAHVIRRNLGPTGHLSNEQCGLALQSMGLDKCRLVVLGHLSEDDNEPRRALNSARRFLPAGSLLKSAPSRVPDMWSDIYIITGTGGQGQGDRFIVPKSYKLHFSISL